MRNQVFKKLFSVLLALIMVAGLLPASVLAEGEGNADSTPAPTEAVQPTESAEPTEPVETETPEVTEVPEPTPENPAATVEPTQGELTAEPTDEGIMVADLYAAGKNGVVLDDKWLNPSSTGITHPSDGFYDGFYRIMFIDNGRKYFSVDSIKQLIDNASAAGFNYLQLAVGNDGMRFLLDDMSLTVNGKEYTSENVSAAIHAGNEAYHNFDVDELTQSDMDTIIAYANAMGMGVIPCVNTPGHMDAILYAASKLTETNCSYSGSARTIDVTNAAAVEFTQALLQKYITYFAGKGCKLFNIGADEYANDKFQNGGMGFGNLQQNNQYSYYVQYVNQVAAMVKKAGMIPMAFNDGIYFNSNTSSGTFDTDILICYWSNGWSGYSPMPVSGIVNKGFKVINAHGNYYWVLGKSDWQCSPEKAKGFDYKQFQGGTVNNPAGAMFLIWCDYPGADTDANVISNTAATIAAFGATLPKPESADITKTDEKTGVAVTAKGLSKITVEAVTAPTISEAAENKVLAYTIALTGENGAAITSGKVTVSFPIPAELDKAKVRGFAVQQTQTRAGAAPETIEGRVEGINYVFDVTLPVESVGIYQTDAATTEKIDLTVNGEVTREQEGNQTINPAVTPDTSIAIVKVEHKYQEESSTTTFEKVDVTQISGSREGYIHDGTNYLKLKISSNFFGESASIESTNKKDEATIFTVTKSGDSYTIKSGKYYLTITSGWSSYSLSTSTSSSKWSYDANGGFYQSIYRNYYLVYSNGWTVSTSSNNSGYLYNDVTTPVPGVDKTVITFTGVAAGTTGVKVGDVTYNIKVTDEAPEGSLTADSITLEYWITNNMVYDGQTAYSNHTKTISKNTQGIESDEGVDMTTLAPNPAYSFFDDTVTVYYWQTMRLDKDHKQTNQAGVDQTAAGTSLTHIRYRNGAWQYKTLDGSWHYFVSGDQLVAYYLQKTEVTKEIDTYVKDWGYGTGSTTPDTSSYKGQVALTVAVVYPDGTVSPAEANMYSSSTTIFNYWENRDIGIVAPVNNSDYTIAKITVTDGARDKNGSANVWYTNDTITWNKKTNAAGEPWYDETEVWNKDSGTTPMVNGAQSNIKWSAKNKAKLVLIYLEVVEKETNLNVHYVDAGKSNVFHQYQVVMKYTEGQPLPTFFTELKQGETVIGNNGPWEGSEPTAANYLPDDAYVVNASGTQQTFKKDITTIPDIHAIYASGLYRYIRADISEDGKTLNLYYNLKETADKTFVVDFGLPVVIPFSDFGIDNYDATLTVSLKEGVEVLEQQGNYGLGKIDKNKQTVTYTLNKMLDKKIPIPVYVWGNRGVTTIVKTVYIIPATNVYYEDSFAKFYGSDGNEQTGFSKTNEVPDQTPGVWYIDGQEKTATQALEALGEKTNHNVYGYDPKYDSCTMFSMGSARKVTVTSTMATTGVVWPTAQFTFKGTGFDIISLTDNTSGAIFVDVYKGNSNSGEKEKGHVVNNYYGYTYSEGNGWEINNNPNAIYQVPVIKVSGLTYGEHTVVIKVCYDKIFDVADGKKYSFWLDAVRVYDPAGNTLDNDYVKDSEVKPIYVEVRKALIEKNNFTADTTVLANGAVFIDGKSTGASIDDYKNFGPNHEVYLAKDQAIAFRIVADREPVTVQIGVKLANGSSGTLKISGNNVVKFAAYSDVDANDTLTLNTATDMYYALNGITWTVENGSQKSNVIVLTNTGENSIVSITNVKCTYANAEESTANTVALAISYDDALMAVDMVNNAITPIEPEPEPEKTFEPERFEASWSRNVMQGRKATLTVKTSEDVEAITVDGQTIRSYRTRTERMGFGRRAKRITYREFTYSMVAQESADFSVTAINAEGTESEAITARLTVKTRPNSMRDMWDWFKGWF